MGFDAFFFPMPDGAHFDFAFQGAERGLGFGELDVGGPERGGVALAGPMGAQQIRAVARDRGAPFVVIPFPCDSAFAQFVAE